MSVDVESLDLAEIIFTAFAEASGHPVAPGSWESLIIAVEQGVVDSPMYAASVSAAQKIQANYNLTPITDRRSH